MGTVLVKDIDPTFTTSIYGTVGSDLIEGTNGNDNLFGLQGRDQLKGGLGNDNLDGDSGKDRLWGGGSNDWLIGDLGSDLLCGGNGYDTLSGGRGSDRFILGAGEGTDTISDFTVGEDLILWRDGLSFALSSTVEQEFEDSTWVQVRELPNVKFLIEK